MRTTSVDLKELNDRELTESAELNDMRALEEVRKQGAADNPADAFAPPFPEKLEEIDVSPAFLADLVLKAVSMESDASTANIAKRLHLGILVTDALLHRVYQEKLIEKTGVVGLRNNRYGMLQHGWDKVKQLISVNSYIGPAPVSLKAYEEMIIGQVRSRPPVTPQAMQRAMINLVLPETMKLTLSLVASSGRSLFLTGPSGNGKTTMARALVNAIPGDLWIPYALEMDGQVIRLYDQHIHQQAEQTNGTHDPRWVRIRPPLVVVGGELTLNSMDLMSTDTQRFYEAPFQVKANGGVLVVDDLGRQRCSAKELLNRWIVPLENRVDYLTLNTGKKIQIPFEQTLLFATNLTDADLTDEAFLRRMGYRLHVPTPSPSTYAEIFIRYARAQGLFVDSDLLGRLLDRYSEEGRTPKCCDPRDLIDRVIDLHKFRNQTPILSAEVLDVAWANYFGGSTPA